MNTSPFAITTQVKCPNCGQIGIVSDLPDDDGEVTGAGLVLTLAGFAVLTLGGWLGGTIVFVHGMRVLKAGDEPAGRPVPRVRYPEKETRAGETR